MFQFQFGKNYREVNPEEPGTEKKNLVPKKFGRYVGIAVVLLLLFVVANTSWYTIQEEQQAVVCTFGQPKAVTEPGLHFKIPLIQTVQKVNTTIQGLTVGYDEAENYTDDAMMISMRSTGFPIR